MVVEKLKVFSLAHRSSGGATTALDRRQEGLSQEEKASLPTGLLGMI